MPENPHNTLKFPKVFPVEAAPATPSRSGSPEPTGDRSSRPSMIPDWSDDDSPTQRGMQLPIGAPPIASSSDQPLLTVLVGLNAGQIFTLDRDDTFIGRSRDADVRIDYAGVSRRHACIKRSLGDGYTIEDLGSTNGVFVNGRRVERVALAGGDRVHLGPALLFRFSLVAADEEALARKLYEGSTRDPLTQLYNRKYASERLAAEVAYAQRQGILVSLVLFDLDHFKRVNDTLVTRPGTWFCASWQRR